MEIFADLQTVKYANKRLVIALGTFDGVHLGHRSIIRQAQQLAIEFAGSLAVLTFADHPLTVLNSQLAPSRITSREERRELLMAMGVEVLIELPFTMQLANLTAADFVEMLQKDVEPLALVVGENFTFGKGASGNAVTLAALAKEKGIRTAICPLVFIDGETVSSTRLRQLLPTGNLPLINQCLGYEYFIVGQVEHGFERGRQLGFPTANLSIDGKKASLPDGVYAVKVHIGEKIFGGVANIGCNPTFGKIKRLLEVHIFDFDEDVYGQNLQVDFVAYLRGEQKFSSPDGLIQQIEKDKQNARKILDV